MNKPEKYQQSIIDELKRKGWDIIAVEGGSIVRNPNDPKPYKYWFIMPFLGSNKPHEEELLMKQFQKTKEADG